MGVRFETDRYPVVMVRFPPSGSVEEVHAWYDAVATYLEEAPTPIAFVDDLRAIEFGSANGAQRRVAADRHDDLIRRFSDKHAGNARLVDGHLVAAVLRVFDWLSPAPWPLATFRDEEAAVGWCLERVREKGGGPPRGDGPG